MFKSITLWIILSTVFIWIAWDIPAFIFGGSGGSATESVTIGTWIDSTVWVTFAVLLLVGHLCGSGVSGLNARHAVIAGVGFITGYILTRLT